MAIQLNCVNCYWSGYPEELVAATDDLDDSDFSCCPSCGGKDFDKEEIDDDGLL